jgi:Superfamily I DNA and RNA helicases
METILEGLNPSQREAVEHIDGPMLILAGAGSGKTKHLQHALRICRGNRNRPCQYTDAYLYQ